MRKKRVYTFDLRESEYEDTGCHYDIFVCDDEGSDNIGSHTPFVGKAMLGLGIYSEQMENMFGGEYTDKFKNLDDVRKYLEFCGLVYDDGLFEACNMEG